MSEIQASIEETGPIARTIKVTISPDHVRGSFDRAYAKLRGRAHLKGFRKGKAPRAMLEQAYGQEIERDVLGELIEEGCAHTIREHKLDVVTSPRLLNHEYTGGDSPLVFEAALDLRPDVKLGDYKGLAVEKRVARVTDEAVAAALEGLRGRMAVLQTVEDRDTVGQGDLIVFSMYGFDGDKPVPGTSGEGLLLEVGGGRFPEDFEKQLPGLVRGVRSPVAVAFPEDHADENLRGRTVRFDVTVTEIKTRVLPALDDDFASEAGVEGCDTLDALRERLRQDLRERARREADRRVQNELLGRLVQAHEFDVPMSMIHDAIHGYMHEMGADHPHDSDESKKLHEALAPRAVGELRAGFLLDAIALAEDVEVTREDLEGRIRADLASAGRRVEEVRRHYSQPGAVAELRRGLLREKAAQVVFDSAAVQEIEVDETQVADRE